MVVEVSVDGVTDGRRGHHLKEMTGVVNPSLAQVYRSEVRSLLQEGGRVAFSSGTTLQGAVPSGTTLHHMKHTRGCSSLIICLHSGVHLFSRWVVAVPPQLYLSEYSVSIFVELPHTCSVQCFACVFTKDIRLYLVYSVRAFYLKVLGVDEYPPPVFYDLNLLLSPIYFSLIVWRWFICGFSVSKRCASSLNAHSLRQNVTQPLTGTRP